MLADLAHSGTARLLLEDRWRIVPLTPALLRERLAAGLVYGWRGEDSRLAGLAVLNTPRFKQQNGHAEARLYVGFSAARPGEHAALAAALRGLAWVQGFPRVSCKVLDDINLLDTLQAAGFERRSELLVLMFERDLV